ncbi:hypothetical protein Vretimale_11678 [Volvox reticuliferus]|uniref:Xrn1 helical domain-containing protein n=1 Tax=Volvox reticuliferus TaxID=1737510 RepID=A0A8J4CQB1_9CHLO|nr:hypothetical protein Vretifemale_14734 [Volvox reticuliferus]GIM07594.1 hypothetical protein Vretimale_11678 [Volvox reticuliferus]
MMDAMKGAGQVNVTRLVQLFSRLAKDEEAAFLRRAEHRRRCHQRASQDAAANQSAFWDAAAAVLGPDGVSVGELPPGVDLDTVMSHLALSPDLAVALGLDWAIPSLDFTTATDQELRAELSKRVSARTEERVMSGECWAADPCGMGLPGYRARYYQARFPEVTAADDVDKIAARAVRAYMDGLSWVYRYYCLGPAALEFFPDDSSVASGGRGGGGGKPDEGAPEGASWTWAYPYHYAPLMQDLASNRIQNLAFRGRKKSPLASAPIRMARDMYDMAYCSLDEWAPPYGPVRPLLQLLCILPPRSAMLALPSELASMLLIAHEMEDEVAEDEKGDDGHHHPNVNHRWCPTESGRPEEEGGGGWATAGRTGRGRRGGGGGREDSGGRGQHRQLRQSGRGGREQKPGFSLLLTSAADRILEPESGDSSSSDGKGGCSSDEEESPQRWTTQQWGRFDMPLGPHTGGSWGLDGAGALSLHSLAQRVSRFFPNNIPPLVDMSGKKHLHTAVVRLPGVHPPLLACVVQEALRCGMQLTAEEKSRNRMLPSDLLVSEPLYRDAMAALGSGATLDHIVWHLMLQAVEPKSAATTASPSTATATTMSPKVGALSPPAHQGFTANRVPQIGGALGLLLAVRARGLHDGAAAAAATARSAMLLKLDVAGLPVAATRASLLPGAQGPPLRVDRSSWRRLAAATARARSFAERVLGISLGTGAPAGQYRRGGGNMPAAQANAHAIGNSHEYASYGGDGSRGNGGGGVRTYGWTGRGDGGGRGRGEGSVRDFGAQSGFSGGGGGGPRGGRSGGWGLQGRSRGAAGNGGYEGRGGYGRGRGCSGGGGNGGFYSERGQCGSRSGEARGGYGRGGGRYNSGYGPGQGRQHAPAYSSQGERREGYFGGRT